MSIFKKRQNPTTMDTHYFENIAFTCTDNIGILSIRRPNKMNALDVQTLKELADILIHIEEDRDCWGLIITGVGNKAFAAGADISEFYGKSQKEGQEIAQWGQKHVFDKIENFQKPVIAAINGYALGGGLELALACHLRIASKNAEMGFPEVSLGLIPGYGGTQRLPALVGKGKAMEMILTGERISAEDAYQWGLINEVTGINDLVHKAKEKLNRMFLHSRTALSTAIKTIHASTLPNNKGFQIEIENFGKLFSTSEFEEGVAAFLEKRKPRF